MNVRAIISHKQEECQISIQSSHFQGNMILCKKISRINGILLTGGPSLNEQGSKIRSGVNVGRFYLVLKKKN